MPCFKNIKKIFLSCLVFLGLTLSVGAVTQTANNNHTNIELVLTQNEAKNDVFKIHQIALFNSGNKATNFTTLPYLIKEGNRQNHTRFQVQNYTLLKYKPSLLKIVINDISIVKTHCI